MSTYRRPEAMRRAVHSLAVQHCPPDQVVVVRKTWDAISGQAVVSMARDRSLPFKLCPVQVEEMSILAAVEAGIKAAQGDVVAFLDDDAVARPEWLARTLPWYEEPQVGAVGGRDVVHTSHGVLAIPIRRVGQVRWYGRVEGNHHNVVAHSMEVDFLKGVNSSYRRCLVGLMDTRLVGDFTYGYEMDLGLGVRRRGYRIMYDPAVVVDHYPDRPQALEEANPGTVFVLNHNQSYVLMKHLPAARKAAFLLYTFLLGDRTTAGLARMPQVLAQAGPQRFLPVARAHFAGKVAGMLSYVSYIGKRQT